MSLRNAARQVCGVFLRFSFPILVSTPLLQVETDLVLGSARECKLGGSARVVSDWLDKRLRNFIPAKPGAEHARWLLKTPEHSASTAPGHSSVNHHLVT
jgi:hypothetical protein